MRLLACHDCQTLEEFPDFDGPPQYDEVLAAMAAKHRSGDMVHMGAPLMHVEDSDWANPDTKAAILKQIKDGLYSRAGTGTGLGQEAYDLRNTFQEDALKCFEQHHRNPACPDYRSREKRLTPDTEKERKELGLSPRVATPGNTQYLCSYCPVQSLVQEAANKKAGLYG